MAPTLLVLEAFPTSIFQIKGRVSLIENRKCGYTCCACYSLKSYSLAEIPRKIPLHITTDSLLGFVRDQTEFFLFSF